MAQDETEFDKLLREAREWEARDRARHPPFGMEDHAGDEPSMPQAPKARVPKPATPQAPKPAEATWGTLKAAMKQAQAQARSQTQATRARKKGNWGWVWVPILLYFVFRHFVR